MNKKKILNDPVYGFVTIQTELIFDLIEHRYFQRLRRIKQMGLTHYVYPGALHTRLHHALGAMHLMQRAIYVLRSKGVEITSDEAEGAMIAILLHDIGHGPYSHTLEGLLVDCSHEDLTLLFMRALNQEFDGKLDLAISIFQGHYHKTFLYQLITGQLDLDRMDYMKRDAFFSGVAEATIGHDRIITMLDVNDGKIVVEQKGRYSVEQFLMARRLMYWQVYLHKAGLAAERMLRRVMELLRQRYVEGKEYPGVPRRLADFMRTLDNPMKLEDPRPVLDDFARLDDVDVVYTLKVLAESDDFLLSFFSGSILNRQLFHTQFMDTKPSAGYIATLAGKASTHFNIPADQATQLIIQGFESIPTYKKSKEEIMILMKNGEVVPMSHIMELRNDSVADTWFLCYPKAIRSNTF